VAGKTPTEVQDALTEAGKKFYDDADATVTVTGFNSQRFYVFGQVGTAGPVPWTGKDTLVEALAKAQPTYLAWPERIIVVRGDQPREGGFVSTRPADEKERKEYEKKYKDTGIYKEMPDNPRHKLTINMMAMIESGDMTNNILLRPDDIIYVQPNPFAALGLALRSILFPVEPVLEAVRVPASVTNVTP
jgi:protein involved in polysaccharide export with SLBB domain